MSYTQEELRLWKQRIIEAEGGSFRNGAQEDYWKKENNKNLVENGYDTRHWSTQRILNHSALKHVPMEVKGVVIALSSLMNSRARGKLTKGNGGESLTFTEICKAINMDNKTVKPLLEDAEMYGIIKSSQVGASKHYALDTDYYHCGKLRGDSDFVKVFQGKIRELLAVKKNKLSCFEWGIVSELLNQMHYESHIICNEPENPNYTEMKVWRAKDIVERLSVTKQQVTKAMKKFNELGIIVEIKVYGLRTIIMNPEMFSRTKLKIDMDKLQKVALAQKDNLTKKRNYIR
ncbi:hypothetical protein P4377_07010 [Bacillus thuringiensis]|nr:hypothetical protein [Bacillus thuringiensis]